MKINAKAINEVRKALNSIDVVRVVFRVETSSRRRSGIHGTSWILMNHLAPNCPKPVGIY
jgi:hypothetical protein